MNTLIPLKYPQNTSESEYLRKPSEYPQNTSELEYLRINSD